MIIWEIIKNMAKQLLITAIVIAISIAVMSVNETAGIILMMLYSSWMVVKSSNKEIPLNRFTAILPGLMSLIIFFFMLGLIGVRDEGMPFIGVALGIIPGWLMARGHDVYEKNGVVYAKRTFFYVFIWVISILFTQGSTLLGMREITDFSLLLNGFSTAMMVVLSIILLQKIFPIKKQNFPTANIINILLPAFVFTFTIIPFSQIVASNGHLKYGKHCNTNSECAGNLMCVNNTCRYKLGRQLDINPAGLMSNAQRIEDPEKLREYQDTFQNRNTARTAEEKAQAVQYSGLNTQNTTSTSTSTQDWVLGDCRNYGGHSGKECSSGKHCASGMCRGHGVPGMDGERYLGYCCNSSIFQSSSQSNPSPPQQSSSTSSSSSPSSESSSFEDEVAKLSSDEYLKNLSFDNWIKNNDNDKSKSYPPPSSIEFTDETAVAGAIAALVMLLASFGLNASMLAAQETATVAMGVSVAQEAVNAFEHAVDDDYSKEPFVRGTQMLEGAKAEKWMKDHGYIKDDKRPELFIEDRLNDFMNSMPSEKGPGLQGFAGDTNDDNNPVGDYVILVDGEPNQMPPQPDPNDNVKKSESEKSTKTDDTSKADDDSDSDENTSNKSESKNDTTTTFTDNSSDSNDTDTNDKKASDTTTQNNTNTGTGTKDTDKSLSDLPETTQAQINDLRNQINNIIKEKQDEGYYVRNPDWVRKGLNGVGELPAQVGLPSLTWHPIDWLAGWKGGQCGEYGEWGIKWSQTEVKNIFGEGTVMTQITAVNSSLDNHNATRIITPNGDRFVLDYWAGMQDEKAVYTEEEWIAQQKKNGRIDIIRSSSGDVKDFYSDSEGTFNKFINKYGEEVGIKNYLNGRNGTISQDDREAIVRSFKKYPWPTK